MNISSYNITDVSYHYIGLRVLDKMRADSGRHHQTDAISRSVLNFVRDKALLLMLREPKGTFETAGEKVCQELVRLQFANSLRAGYELTKTGKEVLSLLEAREYVDLRKRMIAAHLRTYDNLRAVVQIHLLKPVWRPIVETARLGQKDYIQGLLEPTFDQEGAAREATKELNDNLEESPKKLEDVLRNKILKKVMPDQKISESLFRAICDRLVSLRLLNIRRESFPEGYEFAKSYSPCCSRSPSRPWYIPLEIQLEHGDKYRIYLCEPNMADTLHQKILLEALDEAFSALSPEDGYYDIPEVRDWVCEHIMIPEAAFDDGINHLLDKRPPILSVGLRYEGISSQRKPLVRSRQDTHIHNLLRRL